MGGPTLLSPNPNNYYIGKGILSIKLDGEGDYIDCGNCSKFECLPKFVKLDHFSSRHGVKLKDFEAVTEKEGTLTIILDELTARNVGFALMGAIMESGASPDEAVSIDIFSESIVQGSIKFVGDNDIGPKWTTVFPIVQITPSKAIGFIDDSWGLVELTGDVLADVDGKFGTATCTFT